ncbi:hypothetical protein HYG86_00425 [Alkalicella caledoniensis]|uniref:Uncharacterized protein n=1 Tax=Alkalicella caledoniensis TaxID=2731377 RepID=A0A7G9W3T5_ALKCA|nr:hypothetical protein [Alkalicella caledoniensis]QNO13347.1 hypothetical protein HYG86_00425 [Alkalicella caledoniensis]
MRLKATMDVCYSIWCKGIENPRTPYAVAYAYVISIRILGNAAFLDQGSG